MLRPLRKIAGVFENTNPEKIANVKEIIDTEITRALDEFKKETHDSVINWRVGGS